MNLQPITRRRSAAVTDSPRWLDHFEVNPTIKPGKFVVKGAALLVDELVRLRRKGKSEDELQQHHHKGHNGNTEGDKVSGTLLRLLRR